VRILQPVVPPISTGVHDGPVEAVFMRRLLPSVLVALTLTGLSLFFEQFRAAVEAASK